LKHDYAVLRCKTCLSKKTTTWLTLKYLGPQDGKTLYTIVFPPLPKLVVFFMRCPSCGSNDQYIRTDVNSLTTDQSPDPEFVDQMPEVTVVKGEIATA
jgi:hypothetical protein